MSANDFTGQYISSTYQRLLQLSSSNQVTDGTGSLVNLLDVTSSFALTASYVSGVTVFNTSSFIITASINANSNIITFTKGDNSTFPITVHTGSSGGIVSESDPIFSAKSSSLATTGSNTFIGNQIITGSLTVTNGITGSLYGTASWAINALTASYANQSSDIVVFGLNQTGTQINKGAVVRISGSNNASDTPRIALADWTNDNLSANTLGLAMSNIANGDIGQILTEGVFTGYDTSTPGWVSGQVLYLSSSGTITGSVPHAPLHGVRLGQVIRVQNPNGSIYVRIDNGYELDELHDVQVVTPVVGDLLIRNTSTWINSKTLSGSYTLSGSLTTNDGVSVQSLTASFVSASSITGSLFGTASWANSASVSVSSSYALSSSYSLSSSYTLSSSFSTNALTASFISTLRAAGNNTEIQFNNNGLLDSTSSFYWSPGNGLFVDGTKILVDYYQSYGGYIGSTNDVFGLYNPTDQPIARYNYSDQSFGFAEDNYIVSGSKHIFNFFPIVALSGITGSLFGTASWARNSLTSSFVTTAQTASYILNAVSSSFALTASYAMNAGGSSIDTGSLVTTSSFNSFTASYTTGSFTGLFTGSLLGTATTASYAIFNPYIVTIGTRIYTDDTSITAGFKGYKHVGYNANIIKTRTIANTSGSIDINVKRSGTTLGTISLSNQSASLDTTLAGWTTQLNTDDLLEFHVSQSSTYITDITLFIDIQSR